jgi:hypothetical protein
MDLSHDGQINFEEFLNIFSTFITKIPSESENKAQNE